MRLPGRLAAAIEVLADLDARKRPASEALREWGLSHRFAGSGDRAAIGNLVYDALRRRASHAYAMGEDTPRALVLSVAVRDWGEAPDALKAGFADDAHAPEALSGAETARLTATEPLAGAPDHVRANLPEWALPSLALNFGSHLVAEGEALAGRPPLDLRVNTLKSDRDRVIKALGRVAPEMTEIAPSGLRIPAGDGDSRTPNVQADEAFLKGWFEVQDEGSQIAAALAGVSAGGQVLDFCAGAGGKTLALAAAMHGKGQLFAHDSDRHRLAPIYDRIKRAGAHNVQVRAPGENSLHDLQGKMHRVLVDAPCTGAGTWRRRPDAKWRLTPEQLLSRTSEQAAILVEAARFVRPGGELIYITCSIFPEENQNQIADFLDQHPDFEEQSLEERWTGLTSRPLPASQAGRGLTLTAHRTATDGFFVARLLRQEGK